MAPFTFTARIRNRIHKSTNLTRFVISSLWLCLHLEPCSCCQVAVVNNGIASTGYSTFNIHGAHVHPRFCYNQLNATTNLANMAFWGLERDGADFNIFLGGNIWSLPRIKDFEETFTGLLWIYKRNPFPESSSPNTCNTPHPPRWWLFMTLCDKLLPQIKSFESFKPTVGCLLDPSLDREARTFGLSW